MFIKKGAPWKLSPQKFSAGVRSWRRNRMRRQMWLRKFSKRWDLKTRRCRQKQQHLINIQYDTEEYYNKQGTEDAGANAVLYLNVEID